MKTVAVTGLSGLWALEWAGKICFLGHSIGIDEKGNVAEGKGNIAEIEFKNLFINSISGTVLRVG